MPNIIYGLIFHRVIPDFMIQGGDPEGNGIGDAGYAIKGEFAENGFENNLTHERGVISMSRSNDPKKKSIFRMEIGFLGVWKRFTDEGLL